MAANQTGLFFQAGHKSLASVFIFLFSLTGEDHCKADKDMYTNLLSFVTLKTKMELGFFFFQNSTDLHVWAKGE